MRPLLYLDTARLGQMAPAAQDAQLDFVRLTAEEPSSLYFEEFLLSGFSAWPAYYQKRFPGLRMWTGVLGLKASLLQLANAPSDWQVLLAHRSLSLVDLATLCQFRVCRNVLTSDLNWPTYEHALERRAAVTGNYITKTALREPILRRGWTARDVIEHLVATFVDNHCDGLFLPAVDHFGIRLPIRDIVRRIEQVAELRFVFIDAAQAFCQVPIGDCFGGADFVVAGAHKWMHAYLPMGIGFFGRHRSRGQIVDQLRTLFRRGDTHDPLLQFAEQMETGHLDGQSETTPVNNLFTSAGAVADHIHSRQISTPVTGDVDDQLTELREQLPGWRPLFPSDALRSRIVLFEDTSHSGLPTSPEVIRNQWLSAGAVVSTFNGLARISMPGTRLPT